jgi:hypothetical protein
VSRVSTACALSIGVFVTCRSAASEPASRWDRVRDPDAARAERVLAEAIEARVSPIEGFVESADAREFLRARAFDTALELELHGGQALASSELWYFLGSSLVYADRRRDEDGRRILRKALAADPESPLAGHAWFDVALASNRLLDFEAEREAYGQALKLAWEEDQRATILANRAEASMSLGDLRAARDDYLAALGLATRAGSEVYALAAWGLAVAYARDDDLPDALKHAWTASSMLFPVFNDVKRRVVPTQAIDLPSVFYTPEHEIFYYRALGEMASAEHAEGLEQRKERLARAVAQWDEYIAAAKKNGDRWIQNAEFQRRWCAHRLGDPRLKQPSGPSSSKGGSGSRFRHPPPTPEPD